MSESLPIQHLDQVVEILGVALGSQPFPEVALQSRMQIVRHLGTDAAFAQLRLETTIIFIPFLEFDQILIGSNQAPHLLLLEFPTLIFLLLIFLLG